MTSAAGAAGPAGPAAIPASELLASLRQNTSEKVLALASHAALPVVVDAGFVNLLRVNFFLDPPDELPFEAEADLLLSPLCREIGDELYELDPAVRNLLLIMLQTRYGPERVRQVALLLEQYTQSTPTWTAQPELEQAQQLTALSFVDPTRAQSWLDDVEAGPRTQRLSHDWYVAMRARLAARPSATAAQDELAAAIAALDNDSARIRLAAVNTLAVLSQLPGTYVDQITYGLARMLRARATSRAGRIGRDVQAALALVGTLHRERPPVHLGGISLAGADLRNLDFRGFQLTTASFYDCRADEVALARADLSSTTWLNVTANRADLQGVDLTGARLSQVSLRGANLTGSRFHGAILTQIDFTDADLTHARMPATFDHLVQSGVDFTGANLDSARFPADLSGELESTQPTAAASSPGESLQRAEHFSQLAEQYEQSGDLAAAIDAAAGAVASLRDISHAGSRLASALIKSGELRLNGGQLDPARRDLEEAVEIYREISPLTGPALYPSELARALSLLTTLFQDDQSSTLAPTFDEAIVLYRQAGPEFRSELARTLLNQALWLLRIVRLSDAQNVVSEAVRLFTELGDDAQLGTAYQTWGDITALQGFYDNAAHFYDRARIQARVIGNRQAEAMALYCRGDTVRHLGQTDDAIASLTEATKIFRQLDDGPWEAISLRTAGQLLDQAGQPAAAAEFLETALARYQSLGDTHMSALTMSDLGHALMESGQSATAVGLLQDALGLIRRQAYPEAEATTLHRLGLALDSVGRLEEAIESLRSAADIFHQVEDSQSEGHALDDLSMTVFVAGRAEEALELSERAEQCLFDASDATGQETVLEHARQFREVIVSEYSRKNASPESLLVQGIFYLVCDVSEAMAGDPIRELNISLGELAATMEGDPNADRARLAVIGYSDHVRTFLPLSTPDNYPTIPAIEASGVADYGTVFEFVRLAIRSDVTTLNLSEPRSYTPVIVFVSASRPLTDNWRASFLTLTHDPETDAHPIIVPVGLGNADEDFIRQVGSLNAFIANPDTDQGEAVRTIVSRLADALIRSAASGLTLPAGLPGFRNILPGNSAAGNK